MQKKVHDTKKDDINKNKNRKYQILINKQIQVIYIPIQKKYFFTITNIKKHLHRHRNYDHVYRKLFWLWKQTLIRFKSDKDHLYMNCKSRIENKASNS
jgi:hypothetical protein